MRDRGLGKGKPSPGDNAGTLASVGTSPEGVNPEPSRPKIPRLGGGSESGRPILTRVRIVLPRLSPQGASGKLATFLYQSCNAKAARSLHPGRFSFGPARRGLSICGGARLDAVPSRFENKLKTLPAKPGVYLFRDKAGEVLYVGKAKSLRNRVRSYFQQSHDTRTAIQQLPERVEDIEVIVTQNEVEALHLEQNLVKRHRPPFNVRLRDDKSFPYIAVTVEDEYPRVMFTRERHRRGVVYFGPYANAKKVRETLDVLNRVFPYRPCEGPKPGRHSGIPCLDYHIDRCLAPCVGYVSKEDYRTIIDQVIEFLSGDTEPIQRELERKMQEAAADERFEEAARYRNRLRSVQHLAERQAADLRSVGTIDVIGLALEGDRAVVQVFPLRDGKLIDRYSFHLENVGGQDLGTVLESFFLEYYGSAPSVPPQIVVPRESGEPAALAQFLSERRGTRVEVRAAERGEKRRLQELATENARHALASEAQQTELKRLRRVEALEELREVLNLEALPIRGQVGMDDFAAMAEVVSRRFSRLADVTSEDFDESFAATPNLVVIDGGKGQLSAALAAMQAFDLPRVAVVALAKRVEEVFVPGRPDPIVLAAHSPGLQLLQRIRDEAHRFAVGFHRQRRDSRSFASIFDELEGVGPVRRRALLQHFGSAERFLAATQEELEGVPGVPAKTARAIYAQLHKAGRA
ncbi:MAG: excinuclease ABC subunit UvrC [Actinobacteria bacterium]|nr:MAG: excinuclease ABC subunit UvrC [Actinomycetota bacterium]